SEEGYDLVLADPLTGTNPGEDLPDTASRGHLDLRGGEQMRSFGAGADIPLGRTTADEAHLSALPHVAHLVGALRVRRSRLVTGQTLGVGSVEEREAERFVEPLRRVQRVIRIDGEPWGELEPPGPGHLGETVDVGPGPLGVDVIGGDRRDATPVV